MGQCTFNDMSTWAIIKMFHVKPQALALLSNFYICYFHHVYGHLASYKTMSIKNRDTINSHLEEV